MVFERPKQPKKPQQQVNSATQRSVSKTGNVKQNNGDEMTLPWLKHPLDTVPNPDSSASFVEYLRWMRSPDSAYKDQQKLQILQIAQENANYYNRLSQLTQRTKLITGQDNWFELKCPWRIRVGGHRGPESILLPAFDALGMPYIPSSTLRGVARTQAILKFTAQGMNREAAEAEIMKYFGGLDAIESDRAGKAIFLDAYPLPTQHDKSGGLSIDIANNIWSWEDDNLSYAPNPQPFFSLKELIFVIGIRPTSRCHNDDFIKIKNWLISGLQSGVGSQVNTGYGTLIKSGHQQSEYFFQVAFSILGQLIHGTQKFKNTNEPYLRDEQNNFKLDENKKRRADTSADAEVRSTAFKSMLRYWFRAFALGVLPVGDTEKLKTYLKTRQQNENIKPPAEVKALEAILFGSITPQTLGWVTFRISDGKIVKPEAKSKKDLSGEQSGILTLSYSHEAPKSSQEAIEKLFKNLIWMMFHLGGVGQGARRPCYSRQERPQPKPPWWRGSTLIPESEDDFWDIPETVKEFKQQFRQRLKAFYAALEQLTGKNINPQQLLTVRQIETYKPTEAVDSNCRIIVCAGSDNNDKPYALAVLHDPVFKKGQRYDADLCGEGAKPSPVWVADLDNYQVVTVFDALQNPRRKYLQKLRADTSAEDYAQIFPLLK